ncbi:MAG TPA: SAM-dependent methyltransferase [Bacteroidales bacterium]|nr:SAM-dependent methyltransferase [Bacteroidales bacterium]
MHTISQPLGKLVLIPTTLGSNDPTKVLPSANLQAIIQCKVFVVENLRSARRFLRSVGYTASFDDTMMFEFDKHSPVFDYSRILELWRNGVDIGLMSEAGCPCIADPGSNLVAFAHENSIIVQPLVGPSSILLALIASGFSGQSFAFHGYLPIQKEERVKSLKQLEGLVKQSKQTQIFMETPFRNNQLLSDIVAVLNPQTRLCIACDITLDSEYIKTQTINAWKKNMPDLNKRTSIFLIG